MRRALSHAAAAAVAALAAVAACSPRSATRPDREGPPPPTEFLLAAGDSTFWVRTDSAGTRVRSAPLTLARYGGRFYELYVGDDDRSYFDAVFLGQRVFRRDLLTGDSAEVFRDAGVAVAARRYAAAHPDEAPLATDEDGSEEPRQSLTTEVDLLDSHGPYLSYAVRTASELRGGLRSASTRRGVVDLRTGKAARVADVVGARAAASVVAEGRRRFAAALDSVRAARDERAQLAQLALGQFVFDPSSFSLLDLDQAPAVAFLAPGRGADAGGYTLPLAPIPVDPAPAWWAEPRGALPRSEHAAATAAARADTPTVADRWLRDGAEVVARYDSAAEAFTITLRATGRTGRPAQWTVGRVHDPVHQLYWLDAPPVDGAVRRALARAFDESALYSDEARTVGWNRRRAPETPRGRGCRVPGDGCRDRTSLVLVNRAPGQASRLRLRPSRDTRHPRLSTR
jgi:hypothetical protein